MRGWSLLARAALLTASTALSGTLTVWSLPALAQATSPEGPAGETTGGGAGAKKSPERAIITADELTHDKSLDTVTARGNVEIQYAGRILLADTVNYQVGKDFASASGHVTVVEPDGTTLFADYMELEDKLKEGLAREIRVRLTDGSWLAGREAVRQNGRTTLSYGVYSPCDACKTDPSRSRAWQVKAVRVIHDEASKDIIYRDARLEMFGIPVAYTPYLSHPDPSVKRRSGLMPPTYGGTKSLGATIKVPYYYVLSPQQDVTIAPMVSTDEGVTLIGEHRLAVNKGRIISEGSITKNSAGQIRNHFKSESLFDIDDIWRGGADVALTSDATYLRTYGFESPSFLTTRPYIEGFTRRSYALMEGYYFQQLRETNTNAESPVVVPLAEWSYVGAPGKRGGWHTADVSTAILERQTGADSRRLSAGYGWHLPYTGPMGDVYRLDLGVAADAYHVNDVPTPASTSDRDGFTGRVVPTAAMTWSLPLERSHPAFHEVIEPIVMGVVSPRGQNYDRIPNEDSLDFEFDETNLFKANRFPGHDRVESGPRVNYGLRYAAYGGTLGRFTATVGQSWHAFPDGSFSATSGMDEELSDYVGRLTIRPGDNLDLIYRFRLDKDNLKAQRNNFAVTVGPPLFRLSGNYLSLKGSPLEEGGVQPAENLNIAITSAFSRYWTVGAHTNYDLGENTGPLQIGGDLTYEDECLAVALKGTREYTYDRDYEGGFTVTLQLVLKTLGEVQTSAGQ